jgi:hypothetical protein
MIKYILKKLFSSNKKIENNDEFIPKHNTVTFWIGEDGLPYSKVYIIDTSPESAQYFADMLFSINTGQYINYILSILVELSSKDKDVNNYVRKVIDSWKNITDNNEDTNSKQEPYIKPTTFNKKHN